MLGPMYAAIRALLGAVLALGAGCGGDDDGGTGPVPRGGFCTAFEEEVCAAAERCGCASALDAVAGTCAELAARACPLADGAAVRMAVDDGSIAYDEARAGRYLDALRAADCTAPPLCGERACIGVSAEGGPCGDDAHLCADGLHCVGGTCRTPLSIGEACSEAAECVSRRCDGGSCAARAEDGDACGDDDECVSGRCDFATGRCGARIENEELCTEHTDCASDYCDQDLELGAGLCQERLADGASCDEDPQCTGGACLRGTCGSAVCDPLI